MSYIGAIWASIPPLWKLVGVGSLAVLVGVAAWIYWPAPGPDPAVKALEAQNADLSRQNELLKATAAKLAQQANAATANGAKLLDQVDALETENAALRGRRQQVRRSGQIRTAAIDTVPDTGLRDAVLTQLAATEAAMKGTP